MNLSGHELQSLLDKEYQIYEIWKDVIYSHTNKGGDYYTDPVLQVRAYSDTNRLPLKVTKLYPPIKKLSSSNRYIHTWSYGTDRGVDGLIAIFNRVGYSVVRIEEHKSIFGRPYQLFYVANIGEKR